MPMVAKSPLAAAGNQDGSKYIQALPSFNPGKQPFALITQKKQ
jgi:hypothetical protein